MFMRNEYRAVVMRQGQVQALMQHIEDKLGVSIERIGFEAQRNAARVTFDNTFDGTPGVRLMLKMDHFKRVAVEYFNLIGATCGQCHSDTLEYVPGRRGVARLKNPFYMPLMAAYVVGAFESMEGVPFKSEWEETGVDTYMITAEATAEKQAGRRSLQGRALRVRGEALRLRAQSHVRSVVYLQVGVVALLAGVGVRPAVEVRNQVAHYTHGR